MKYSIYYIIITFFFFSCNSNQSLDDNEGLSVKKEFYPNGDLKFYNEYNLDSGDGFSIEYYLDSIIKRKGKYKNFKPFGFWSNYSEKGVLEYKQEFIHLDTNENYLNQIIFYDVNGEVDFERSSFFDIQLDKRKININDSLRITFRLASSVNKYGVEIRLGELTENYQWKDSSLVDTVYAGKYYMTIPMIKIADKLGSNVIQGQIIDYSVKEIGLRLLKKERVMYFSEEYFVESK